MPSVTQQQQQDQQQEQQHQQHSALSPGRKRRRDDDAAITKLPLYENVHGKSACFAADGSPSRSDHRTTLDEYGVHHSSASSHNYHHTQQPPLSLTSRKIAIPCASPKRVRLSSITSGDEENQYPPRDLPSVSPRPATRSPTAMQKEQLLETSAAANSAVRPCAVPSADSQQLFLGRCHICHRKPSKKTDLDDFADCHGCGRRTCYVCIRQCAGWQPPTGGGYAGIKQLCEKEDTFGEMDLNSSIVMEDADRAADGEGGGGDGNDHNGRRDTTTLGQAHQHQQPSTGGWATGGHRQTICSRCCVERGTDGDVVCFGCLPFVEG